MSVIQRVFGGQRASVTPTSLAYYYEATGDHRATYDLLRAYYYNNGLYDELRAGLVAVAMDEEALKPLRNPANRVVEFYAAKLWPGSLPGALPIETENEAVGEAISRMWGWSNWGTQKQVAARWLSLYGSLFVKVANRPGRVFLQLIDPRYVPDFDTDERGFLTYFRADVPQVSRNGDEVESQTYTEVWDKGAGTFRVWVHDQDYGVDVEKLPPPDVSEELGAFGIDFVPVVHLKHRDTGDDRGDGAFTHAVDKIDEANRMATRLHMMLFRHNRNLWALKANLVDPSGRPMPAPRIGSDGSDELTVGDNTVVRLPGNSELQSMVPDLRYDAALAVLNAHLGELEHDLPELAYYRLKERGGDLSGRAVRMLLSDAIDRVIEVRGNAESGLARADEMALTLGQVAGLGGFETGTIGTYEAGDFGHTFMERDVIPMGEEERSQVMATYVQGGLAVVTAMRRAGWSNVEIQEAQAERLIEAAQAQSSLAEALLAQQREFDRGLEGGG